MTQSKTIEVAGRAIGPDHPPYVIAELSGNHNGDLERAFAIMDAAKDAGADALKLQTYTADTITIDHDGPDFRIQTGGLWDGQTLYDLYKEAHTPWAWHPALFAKGKELGITVFSAPFDFTAVDFLEGLNNPVYKIASFEAIDTPLIEKAAATGKPMIISTGMADRQEISQAAEAARATGSGELILLHCVSGYPTPVGDSNLRTIPDLACTHNALVGLSDHTLGVAAAAAAVALGACVIEKHITLNRADGGPDAAFSLEPAEFKQLVEMTRAAWEALGTVNYARKESEAASTIFRCSLYVVADMKAGETFTTKNIRSIRPGHGLKPVHLKEIIGRTAAHTLARGTALDWSMIELDES